MTAGELLKIIDEMKKARKGDVSTLADLAGINRSYLSKFINGDPKKNLTPSLLRKINKVLGYKVEESDKNNELHEPEAEYSSKALFNLTESNRESSEANRLNAAANKVLAENQRELILMLKAKGPVNSAEDQRTQVELIGTVLGMRTLLEEIAVRVTKQPIAEIRKDLGKKVMDALKKVEQRDSVPADGN